MPTPASSGKKGRVNRVTRAHEDVDVVRVEHEGDEGGPVAEVVESRQTRSSVSNRNKGTRVAELPASQEAADVGPPADDTLDIQEAEELLSEAEEILHEPLQGGKTKSTTKRHTEAGPSRLTATDADVVPDTQHQIEEVPADTAGEEAQEEPHVEEPESSVPTPLNKSAAEAVDEDGTDQAQATSKAKSADAAQAKSGGRSSKQAEKGKAAASAPVTPVKKGRAAAKRAAEPTSERQPAQKKAAKGQPEPSSGRNEGPQKAAEPSKEAVPSTPAKAPQTPAKPPQTPNKQPQEAATKKPTGISAFMTSLLLLLLLTMLKSTYQ